TLNEFYAPVINGTLPAGLAAGTYKLRVRATTGLGTTPETYPVVETLSFNIILGSSDVPSATSELPNNSSFLNCTLSCLKTTNIFGSLTQSFGATSTILPKKKITICNYSNTDNYKITLIDLINGTQTPISYNNINGDIVIPDNLTIGTYIFEIEKNNNSVYSLVFLFHGNGTSLGNSTSEVVCVGVDVSFTVDITNQGIGRNYNGSKYKIDFGDNSALLELTQAELMSNPTITHNYSTVSCAKTDGNFIIKETLLNEGVYNGGANANYCTEFYKNGNGVEKKVNVSLAPKAEFLLSTKQCVNLDIIATNKTILGSYGNSGTCLDKATFIWYYKKPRDLSFTEVTISSWIDSSNNLTIPKAVITIPGCWEIKLTAINDDLCQTVTEANHIIKIEATPIPSFTNAPQSPICSGTSIQFTNTSNTASLPCQDPIYEWAVTPIIGTPATTSGSQFVNPSTSASQNPLILFTQPGSYSVVLKINNSCGTFSSIPKIIEVFGDPTVSFSPNTLSICNQSPPNYIIDFNQVGTKPNYSVAPYAPTSFLWSISGSGVTAADYSYIGGTTTSSQFPKINFTAFKTYTIKVKVNGNCAGSNEAFFTFTLKETPVITNTNLSQTICTGSATTAVSLASNMVSGTTYSWTVTATSGTGGFVTPGSGNAIPATSFTNTTNSGGTVTYSVTPSNNGCPGAPVSFVVYVNPIPLIPNQNISACSGSAFILPLTNNPPSLILPAGTTFTWTASNPTGITGASNQNAPGTNSISQTLTNATNAAINVIYNVTASSGTSPDNCTSNFTVTVTVDPKPLIPNQAVSICSGVAFSVPLTNNPPSIILPVGTTFTWTVNNPAGISGAVDKNTPGASSISQILSNSTNAPISVTYNVIASSGITPNACTTNFTVTVTVNPLPTATIGGAATVCLNDSQPTITFTGANGAAPYTFTYNINGGASQTIATTSGNSITVAVPTTTAGTFNYNLINVQDLSTTTCSQSLAAFATVIVRPLPTATILGTTSICQGGAPPEITFIGANGTAPYTFTYNINGGSTQTVTTTAGNSVTVNAPTITSGIFTYNLVSVAYATATSCPQPQTGSATVSVNPSPTASIGGTTTVCLNTTPQPFITFTGAEGSAPYTFTYNINGGTSQTITTTSGNSITMPVSTTTAGTFAYNLVSVQDSASPSCSKPQTATATIIVKPLPTATIGGTTTICLNGSQPVITFTGAEGAAPYTFTYNVNGGTIQTIITTSGNSVTLPVSTATSGNFVYTLLTVQDGTIPSCTQSQTGTATITVNTLPSAAISGTTTICQGDTSPQITFTGSDGASPYKFSYNINGGATQTVTTVSGNSASVNVPTTAAGSFIYNLISVQYGTAPTCAQPQTGSATVTINAAPTATISGTTAVCLNDSQPTITFTGANGVAPYTFTYNINGGASQTIATTSGNSITVAV
ncbi:MAG: hypothetical protein QMB11_01195, partial [Nonlabens sp.]|uniref:beta strand repeat-containing protein n=1 Tax=Nonlabens sp. TaxID=1888209 RepID=UPI0035A5807B